MALLRRSETAESLKYAFAGGLLADRRSTADGRAGHAHGDPDYSAAWAIRPPPGRWAKLAAI